MIHDMAEQFPSGSVFRSIRGVSIEARGKEGHIPPKRLDKTLLKFDQQPASTSQLAHSSQSAGQKRGYVKPPIPEIQALIGRRRTVFGWLFSGQIDGCMNGQAVGGLLDCKPVRGFERPSDRPDNKQTSRQANH